MNEPGAPLSLLFLNPTGVEVWGGVEAWMYGVALALDGRGYTVHAAGRRNGKFADAMTEAGVETISIRGRNDLSPTDILRLRRLIRSASVDIVVTKLNRGIRLAGLSALAAGGRVAVMAHMGLMEAKPGFFSHSSYRWLMTGVNVPCHAIGDRLVEEHGFDPNTVHVVPYGIDTKRFYPDASQRHAVRRAFGLEEQPVVVIVARLDDQKGHADFLHALADTDGVHAMIVGTGPLEGRLKSLARALRIADRAHFLGHRDDVPHILHGADLLALSSYDEGLPYVCLEAMAVGLPIVATRVGGLSEIVRDARTGFLVEPGDPMALAQAIRSVLESPARGRALGEAGRQLVLQRYHMDRMVDGVEHALHDLICRRRHLVPRAGAQAAASAEPRGAVAPEPDRP